MTGWIAAVLAAMAAWLLVADARPASTARSRRAHEGGPRAARAVAVLLALGAGLVLLGSVALLGAAGAVVTWMILRTVRSRRVDTARSEQEAAVARAVRALAGQLRAGRLPVDAAASLADELPALATVVATARLGGAVPEAIRRESSLLGREGLADLARAWELSGRVGAPLAGFAENVAEDLRVRAEISRAVDAELASTQATSRILAALPLIGLAMGWLSGAAPVHFLLTTSLGRICVFASSVLACAGMLWTDHLIREARR